MSRFYQRPENALKRANEFIEVGKPIRALDALAEVIKSKKYRSTTYSEKVLEPIMIKYLELCVDLKKAYMAKEGLFQYRNMCQSVNVASLENVVRFYLNLAEEKTEAARQESHQAVVDIDDLDNVATPESILLSAVSGEDAQDRSDRVILTPWVKFLWESYRQCLELLRTNSRVEKLYHDTAQHAFKFCLKYARKTEFRKLCENLRSHLALMVKGTPSVTAVNLSNPETQQMNLETRLLQLDFAIQMELWQEAYKAIEDIHGLMILAKKMPRPQQMAQYYQKIALVFGKSGNHLFHAAALFRLFQLSRDLKKNITTEELQKLGSRVLVATLAVPLPSAHPEFDRFIETEKSALEKTQKLATLLHLNQPPTRNGLIKDLVRLGVVATAMPQLQQLYHYLEVEFDPLHLCNKVKTILSFMAEVEETSYLSQYIHALEEITLTRLVKQIAQLYSSIRFERLVQLAPFASPFDLERIVVNAVRHTDMQIRIDHRNNCLHFGTELFEAQREDLPEGPTLQAMPSEQIRTHLISMYCVLSKATIAVVGNAPTKEERQMKAQIAALYHQNKVRDHHQLLSRQKIIEDRKEYLEKLNTEREEEEGRRQEELIRQQLLAEQRRLEVERQERERLRQEAELRQVQARHLKEKVAQFSQTAIGQKVIKKMEDEDISKLDPDVIMARQLEELEKERKELQTKLRSQEKKVDFLERAKRIEEIPLLEKYLAERKVQDKLAWKQQEEERIAQLQEERKVAMLHRDRLMRMRTDKEKFIDNLKSARKNIFKEKLAEFESMYDAVRTERLKQRKEQRREQRRIQWVKEREEAEQRKRDEELKRQREEAERIEQERRQAELEELRKRREAADQVLLKQREREREIEEKQKRREEEERERDREAREKEREHANPSTKERPAESSWRRGPPENVESRQAEPYRPPKEPKWRNNRSEKYSSRPESDDIERRDDRDRREVDDRREPEYRRDRDDRREPEHRRDRDDRREPEQSSWRTAKDVERPREQRPERGGRDFAALRDPTRKNIELDRPSQFRDEEKFRRDDREIRRDDRDIRRDDREFRRDDREFRRDDREIRRDDREIRRAAPPSASRDGESNWRSARGPVERPTERGGDREQMCRQPRSDREDAGARPARSGADREERERPDFRLGDREREKPKIERKEIDADGFTKVSSRR
ncbi:eukaryotic translation initiation factor 3 subunit A-like [Daphnia carinata]|uniref:eukaryotic translation initiation factor 3 subunit A-like n=1 Tax=Daphnia carinata TaxID=120202 RepID=UPI00257CE58A|nr:eukaryotic translation initiation factor 3 subunit A-like [Daphnia carinata]